MACRRIIWSQHDISMVQLFQQTRAQNYRNRSHVNIAVTLVLKTSDSINPRLNALSPLSHVFFSLSNYNAYTIIFFPQGSFLSESSLRIPDYLHHNPSSAHAIIVKLPELMSPTTHTSALLPASTLTAGNPFPCSTILISSSVMPAGIEM